MTAKIKTKLKFCCIYCPEQFKDLTSLQNHYKEFHVKICSDCGNPEHEGKCETKAPKIIATLPINQCTFADDSHDWKVWHLGYEAQKFEMAKLSESLQALANELEAEVKEVSEIRAELKTKRK